MYLVFDIGGTNTRLGISKDGKKLAATHKFKTPKHAEEGIAEIAREARTLLAGEKLVAIGGGIRSPLSEDRNMILDDPVLEGWVGKPIRTALEQIFSVPVFIGNDAAMVGLGEAHYGAGRGHDIVAYLTISTGVGGARIVHGRIDETNIGFEPGKQIVDLDATKVGGGARTLEELISGTSLEARRGVKPYDIPQDDPVWDELARYLAVGLMNTVAYWSPDVIVIGGSMMIGDPRIPLAATRLSLSGILKGHMPCPPIFDATLKDEGGLYGSMVYVGQQIRRKKR